MDKYSCWNMVGVIASGWETGKIERCASMPGVLAASGIANRKKLFNKPVYK